MTNELGWIDELPAMSEDEETSYEACMLEVPEDSMALIFTTDGKVDFRMSENLNNLSKEGIHKFITENESLMFPILLADIFDEKYAFLRRHFLIYISKIMYVIKEYESQGKDPSTILYREDTFSSEHMNQSIVAMRNDHVGNGQSKLTKTWNRYHEDHDQQSMYVVGSDFNSTEEEEYVNPIPLSDFEEDQVSRMVDELNQDSMDDEN